VPNKATQTPQIGPEESGNIVTSHKQVVEALLRFHGIHEGVWGLFVRFGLGAANIGAIAGEIVPAAVVPVVEIGLQKFKEVTNISVDAAEVNPKSAAPKKQEGRSRK